VIRNFLKVFVPTFFIYTVFLLTLRHFFDFIAVFDSILLSTGLTILVLGIIGILKRVRFSKFIKDVVIILLILYILFSMVLVNVDRSRSVFDLNWVEKNLVYVDTNGYNLKLVNSSAAEDYFGIVMRLDEQMSRNLITKTNSQIFLTYTGRILLEFFNFTARAFNLQGFYNHSK